MTFNEVAAELVAGCRENRTMANLDTLYAQDAVSVEAADMGNGRETHGIAGIRGKHEWWDSAFEVLEASVSDPMPNGEDRFAVIFEMKVKNKETGIVEDMKEVALYTVSGDKICKEEFFYGM